jgi:hypothetical protein
MRPDSVHDSTVLKTIALNNNNTKCCALSVMTLPEGVVGGMQGQPPGLAAVCVIEGHIPGFNYLQVIMMLSTYMHYMKP